MKAQATRRHKEDRAIRFFGKVANHSFDLDPLAEEFARSHAPGGRFARLRYGRRTNHSHIRAIDERRENSSRRAAFHNHYLTRGWLIIGIGISDANARRAVLDIDHAGAGIRVSDQALKPHGNHGAPRCLETEIEDLLGGGEK